MTNKLVTVPMQQRGILTKKGMAPIKSSAKKYSGLQEIPLHGQPVELATELNVLRSFSKEHEEKDSVNKEEVVVKREMERNLKGREKGLFRRI